MVDGSGFCGVSSVELVDAVEVPGGGAAVEARLVGVQVSLFEALDDIRLWVDRLRDGGGPLLVDEVAAEIERAISVCDGQLSLLDGPLS